LEWKYAGVVKYENFIITNLVYFSMQWKYIKFGGALAIKKENATEESRHAEHSWIIIQITAPRYTNKKLMVFYVLG